MKKWVVEGGHRLSGQVEIGGAKNVAIKLMIAALLSDAETTLSNVSQVGDVLLTAKMIRALGAEVEFMPDGQVTVLPRDLCRFTLPPSLARQNRAASLFIGPLLSRCGTLEIPLPGGDRIGRRPLDRHLAGLRALGAHVERKSDFLLIKQDGLRGAEIRFNKNTHTGTETMILAAVLAAGTTAIENAAMEPEIDDLIDLVNKMGARVKRVSPRRIVIEGVARLHGATHRVMPDRNKAVSYACMALATRGEVEITNMDCKLVSAFLDFLDQTGGHYDVGADRLHVAYQSRLRPVAVTTSPYPGIMSDWQPLITTLLTQAEGQSTVHETIFENRFGYVAELARMGAQIEMYRPELPDDPQPIYNFNWQDRRQDLFHALQIKGPTNLRGTKVHVNDVRAGATLVQAALTAKGTSILTGVEHIKRGYERLDGHLRSLGAHIEEVEDT